MAFYSGLRKTELLSRLLSDMYMYEDILYIDVNNKGMRKIKQNLKTRNAKRRVEVKVNNEKHLQLIKQWFEYIKNEKKHDHLIFTQPNKDFTISKKKVCYSNIDFLNKIIKEVTQRYCTFHSLRHSYASYQFKEIIIETKETDKPYLLIELCTSLGHETPKMTINKYLHYDLLRLL